MAMSKLVFTELRPCVVRKTVRSNDYANALFHIWVQESDVVAPSPMIGGHPGGTVNTVLGLVEFEDGSVKKVYPGDIVFIDSEGKFKEYDFSRKGEEKC